MVITALIMLAKNVTINVKPVLVLLPVVIPVLILIIIETYQVVANVSLDFMMMVAVTIVNPVYILVKTVLTKILVLLV